MHRSVPQIVARRNRSRYRSSCKQERQRTHVSRVYTENTNKNTRGQFCYLLRFLRSVSSSGCSPVKDMPGTPPPTSVGRAWRVHCPPYLPAIDLRSPMIQNEALPDEVAIPTVHMAPRRRPFPVYTAEENAESLARRIKGRPNCSAPLTINPRDVSRSRCRRRLPVGIGIATLIHLGD